MGDLGLRLLQMPLVSAARFVSQPDQGQPDQPRPAIQRLAVRQNDLAVLARPGTASYAAAPRNALTR
jgi:hypothetical protein